jgi:hypothetical protein
MLYRGFIYFKRLLSRTLAAFHFADYKPIYVIVNGGIFFILVIAKIPEMHRVRLFGINSGPQPVKLKKTR